MIEAIIYNYRQSLGVQQIPTPRNQGISGRSGSGVHKKPATPVSHLE